MGFDKNKLLFFKIWTVARIELQDLKYTVLVLFIALDWMYPNINLTLKKIELYKSLCFIVIYLEVVFFMM